MIFPRNGKKTSLREQHRSEESQDSWVRFKYQHVCGWAVTLRNDFLLWVSSLTCKMRIIFLSYIHSNRGPAVCQALCDVLSAQT